jgi:hypothetical protein
LKGGSCYEARDGKDIYRYVEDLSLVPIFTDKEPGYGILFVARRDAGRRRFASLWTYSKAQRKFVNIAPPLTFAMTGEVVLLSEIHPDMEGLLAVPDSADQGYSGALSDAYPCTIRLFRYSDGSGRFEPVGSGYTTRTKYDGGPFSFIISGEIDNIRKYLSGALPEPVPEGRPEEGYMLADKNLSLARAFNLSERWQASAYDFADEEAGGGKMGPPARLCFSGPALKDGSCFEAKVGEGKDAREYNFFYELSLVPLFSDRAPGFGVLFVADGIEYGLDMGKLVTLWTYSEKERTFVNVLPPLTYMTWMGAFKLLSELRPDMEGLLAMSNFIWTGHEGRWDRHRYTISLYRYSEGSGRFEPAGRFVTKRKYGAETDEDIFRREMKGIERLARGKRTAGR